MAAATSKKASDITSPTTTKRPVWVSPNGGGPASRTRRLYHCDRVAKPCDSSQQTVGV
jgi:hypothetical protein